MNPIVVAALQSWNLDGRVIAVLVLTAVIYVRGWARGRRLVRLPGDEARLCAFLAGLAALFLATESPLDAFDSLSLSAHMTQHMLLLMIAPPLVLLGHPFVPLLRGLPKTFVKEGLGPFLSWPALRRLMRWLVFPPVAWAAFAVSTLAWHLPRIYELALRSPGWHEAQHASFFWTGILFWWPVVEPVPGRPRWPRWIMIPYLLSADILNTGLSAFFVFSGGLLYATYNPAHLGINAQNDQILAGLIMWVPGSLVYLVPAIVISVRLFADPQAKPVSAGRARAVPRQENALTRVAAEAAGRAATRPVRDAAPCARGHSRRIRRPKNHSAQCRRRASVDPLACPFAVRASNSGECLLHGLPVHVRQRYRTNCASRETALAQTTAKQVARSRAADRLSLGV